MYEIPIIEKKKRVQGKCYIKPASVKELEKLHFECKKQKHPDVPYILQTKFRDDTANGLTKCITSWLELNGYFSARINTTGTYNSKLGKWIYSGSKKGMADITAILKGKHISVEIKSGKDKPRPEQLKVKQEVEAAGGVYIFVRNFDDFLTQINKIL